LQYGWKPLLHDAYSGAQFLAHQLSAPAVKRYTAVLTSASLKTAPLDTVSAGSYSGALLVTRKCSRQIIAFLSESNVSALTNLIDPLTVAWELMPYSFVVDWFAPIGSYLSARGLSSQITGEFVTTHLFGLEKYGKPFVVNTDPNVIYSPLDTFPFCKFTYLKMDRYVATSLSVPVPQMRPLSSVPSWGKAENALALLTQLHK
jgi:hypothetical protein